MKFSLAHIFTITFWFAVTLASISVIRSTSAESLWVTQMITSVFSLATLAIVFSGIITAIYGNREQRPFWVGFSIVCTYLLFGEQYINLGLMNLCEMAAELAATKGDGASTGSSLNNLLGLPNAPVERAGLTSIFKNFFTPLLALIGGIFAQSIHQERVNQESS